MASVEDEVVDTSGASETVFSTTAGEAVQEVEGAVEMEKVETEEGKGKLSVLVIPGDITRGKVVCTLLRDSGCDVTEVKHPPNVDDLQSGLLSSTGKGSVAIALRSSSELYSDDEEGVLAAARESDGIVVFLQGNEQRAVNLVKQMASCDSKATLVAVTSPLTWAGVGGGVLCAEDESAVRTSATCTASSRMAYEAENELLRARASRGLNVHVVCPGILYGCGEFDGCLHRLFKDAWMGKTTIGSIGDGKNRLPTTHVSDLAASIRALLYGNSSSLPPYIFTVDPESTTQKDLLGAIIECLSSPTKAKPTSMNIEEAALDEGLDQMFLDLEFQRVSHESLPPAPFSDPFDKRMAAIVDEYIAHRRLQPLRLMVLGAPGTPYMDTAMTLGQEYGLKVITRDDIEEIGEKERTKQRQMEAETAAAEERKRIIEEKRVKADEEESANPENVSDAGGEGTSAAPLPEEGNNGETAEQEHVVSAIELEPEELTLEQKLGYALELNHSLRTQGLVFVNPFLTSEEFETMFTTTITEEVETPEEEAEEEAAAPEEKTTKEVQVAIASRIPELCLVLSDEEETLRKLSDDAQGEDQATEDEFATAFAEYKTMIGDEKEENVPALLERLGGRIATCGLDKSPKEVATTVKRAVGKPRNYVGWPSPVLSSLPQDNDLNIAVLKKSMSVMREPSKTMPPSDTHLVDGCPHSKLGSDTRARSAPLTSYLNKTVMPAVLEGMLKLCNERPEDPVEELARFLEACGELLGTV